MIITKKKNRKERNTRKNRKIIQPFWFCGLINLLTFAIFHNSWMICEWKWKMMLIYKRYIYSNHFYQTSNTFCLLLCIVCLVYCITWWPISNKLCGVHFIVFSEIIPRRFHRFVRDICVWEKFIIIFGNIMKY